MTPTPAPDFYQSRQPPAGRHGCLTAWLIFMIVANALTAVASPFLGDMVRKTIPNYPPAALYGSAVLGLINIACAVGLLRYQKWGFWGFVVVSVIALIMNLALGLGFGNALGGLVGVGILYGLLNMGDENTKAWPRLK